MKQSIIEHMNLDHKDVVEAFYKKFGNYHNFVGAKLVDLDENALILELDGVKAIVPFLQKVTDNNYKDAIIALWKSCKVESDFESLSQNLRDFILSRQTLIIASISNSNSVASYAPFVCLEGRVFIAISSVAKHLHSIRQNPNSISIMFIQDESEAKSPFARIRAVFDANAKFIDNDELKNRVFDEFAIKNPSDSAIKFIRKMSDFKVVELELLKGRFVRGFGAAFDTKGFSVTKRVGGDSIPHQMS
ncbi:MAG: DUF2470 domain-containing protein [Campylobacter sp.]|nr:DUF2470 domain-containing protein [Campylobacter sp.]